MKSLHQSAHLAKVCAEALNATFCDFIIDDIYSTSKAELVFKLQSKKEETATWVFNFSADNLLFLLPQKESNRPRLANEQFKKAIGAKITAINWIPNDRIIKVSLTQHSAFYIFFYGRRSDVIYVNKEGHTDAGQYPFRSKFPIEIQKGIETSYDVALWDDFWKENRFLPVDLKFEGPFDLAKSQNYVNGLNAKSIIEREGKLVLSDQKLPIAEQLSTIHQFNLNFLITFSQERRKKEEESLRIKYEKQINQRLAAAKNKLLGLEKNNRFQLWGDVIMSNLSTLNPKLKTQLLTDWVASKEINVPINIEKSAIENANKYYQKAKNAHKEIKFLKEKITSLKKQLVVPNIPKPRPKEEKQVAKPYYQFEFGGFEIRVGKSAEKNDDLIKNHSHKNDLWLHAKSVAGSHVIIRNPDSKEISNALLEYAASLAAKYSKQKGQTLAAVTYTPRKYVRKNKKMLPGQVRLEKEETILVKPAE